MNTMNPAVILGLETEDLLFTPSDSVSLNKEFERRFRTLSKRDIYEEGRGASGKVQHRLWFARTGSRVNIYVYKVVLEEKTEPSTPGFFDLNKDSPLYADMEDILERKKTNQLRFYTHAEVWNE